MATESFYTESGTSPPSRKESARKYRESHRAQRRAYDRQRQQLPEVKARRNETARLRYERKVLASSKGKPLRSDFTKPARPAMLTRLILQEAESFCLKYGFSLECKLDSDVLEWAAETIRDNPFYPVVVHAEEMVAYHDEHGITNPWYRTEYLHDSLITKSSWSSGIRCKAKRDVWRKELQAEQEAARQHRIESGEELDLDALLANLNSQEVQS